MVEQVKERLERQLERVNQRTQVLDMIEERFFQMDIWKIKHRPSY
ncbi:hypothetical protein [Schnuerera sp. xch1]|nr:hypothetical protein [Schnuerera sp. xch1]